MKVRVLFVLFFLSIFIFFNDCVQQKAKWEGTIEEIDGVSVVNNPIEPMYKEEVLKLEEELTIGEAEIGYSDKTDDLNYGLNMYDNELKLLKNIGSIPGIYTERGRNLFPSFFSWYIDNNDNLVYGYQKEYELKIFNSEGKLIKKILKKHITVKITEEEIDERKKDLFLDGRKLDIPKFHSAFRAFIIDEEDRIFVMTWEKTKYNKGFYYDVFDSKGRYVAKIPLKAMPRVWKNNKLYTIEEDKDGYQYIKRYKATWKF